jgi:hypothetical protein
VDRSEVVLLLTLAGTYDYRKVGDADVESWFLALDDVGFVDAKVAVVRHYRESTDRMMPAHVRRGVKVIRDERKRLNPHEVRALPSRFETDMNRQVRMERGAATVHDVLATLAVHMDMRSPAPTSALDELRAITAGPGWSADGDNAESEATL